MAARKKAAATRTKTTGKGKGKGGPKKRDRIAEAEARAIAAINEESKAAGASGSSDEDEPTLGGSKTPTSSASTGNPPESTDEPKLGAGNPKAPKAPSRKKKLDVMEGATISKVKLTDLKKLRDPLRKSSTPSMNYDMLFESLKLIGQVEPIVITAEMEVVNGNQRWKVAKELKFKTLKAIVLDSNIPADVAEMHLNISQSQIRIEDLAKRFSGYLKKNKWTERRLADYVGMSQTRVHDIVATLKATDEERALWRDGVFSTSIIMELVRQSEDIRKEAVKRAKKGKPVSTRDVKAAFSSVVLPTMPEGVQSGRVSKDFIEVTYRFPIKKGQTKKKGEALKVFKKTWTDIWNASKNCWRKL